MDDRKRRNLFKTKLPCIQLPEDKAPSSLVNLFKLNKPRHDPFFYISKGQKSRISPALPPGLGLPHSSESIRSPRMLEPIDRLNRYKSLERLKETRQPLLPVPSRRLRVPNPPGNSQQSFKVLNPCLKPAHRVMQSAEEHLLEETEDASGQITSLIPCHYADATFRVIKW